MSTRRKIIIIGTRDIAILARYYIGGNRVAAFSAHRKYINEDRVDGLPVVPLEELASKRNPDKYLAFVAIGYQKTNSVRTELLALAKSMGYETITVRSELAVVSPQTEIGYNCLISPMCYVERGARIGNNVFIRTGAYIGHDAVIKDNCWIGAKAIIGGSSYVGQNTFAGYGSIIRDKIHIGKSCIIGAGTFISRDTQDNEVYTAPHAVLSSRKSHEVTI